MFKIKNFFDIFVIFFMKVLYLYSFSNAQTESLDKFLINYLLSYESIKHVICSINKRFHLANCCPDDFMHPCESQSFL